MARLRTKERMAVMFNEDSLRSDIVDKWGPAGAHVDVFDELLRRYNELRALITAWADAEVADGFHDEPDCNCGAPLCVASTALRKAVGR